MQYVGFGRRLVAAFLDGIIISVLGMLLGVILGVFGITSASTDGTSYSTNPVVLLASWAIAIGYVVFYQAKMGQTLGKKAMGIKVVDSNGKTPSALTFFIRDIIGKIVSTVILFIGYLMVLWDGKKQALHDKIAGTYVVRA